MHADDDDDELDEVNDIDQQALLPSVRDPKLWLVKCAVRFLSCYLFTWKFD